MNKYILLSLLGLLFLSCETRPKTDYEKLEQFCSSYELVNNLSTYKLVVIINDKGDCLNCNNIFANKMSSRINESNILFILSEDGTKVDISAYIDGKSKNIIWDINGDFDKLNLVKSCSIFELGNHQIIDRVVINANNATKY